MPSPAQAIWPPPAFDETVDRMVRKTDQLARLFAEQDRPLLVLQDCHRPNVPEPPYPPHCEMGSGEEELVDALQWLSTESNVTLMKKDVINGFVGGMKPGGSHLVIEWVNSHELDHLVIVGICTDICVMQFVQTMLSARNHFLKENQKMMPTLKDLIVVTQACATYDLPRETAKAINAPEVLSHPQALTHYMGLYFMHMSGAILTEELI